MEGATANCRPTGTRRTPLASASASQNVHRRGHRKRDLKNRGYVSRQGSNGLRNRNTGDVVSLPGRVDRRHRGGRGGARNRTGSRRGCRHAHPRDIERDRGAGRRRMRCVVHAAVLIVRVAVGTGRLRREKGRCQQTGHCVRQRHPDHVRSHALRHNLHCSEAGHRAVSSPRRWSRRRYHHDLSRSGL